MTKIERFSLSTLLAALAALLFTAAPVHAEQTGSMSGGAQFDENLVPVKDVKVDMAWIDPNADFGVFKRVTILEPIVAFRANWQRDQNRSTSHRVSARDMERIKSDVATLFERVFTDRLEAAGFEVVDVAAEDVLLLRPSIINLDVTAPDNMGAGRSRTFTTSPGTATLYIELYDSLSGDIIGRAADRQTVRKAGGMLSWSSRVTNRGDAQRMIGRWADQLVSFLKSHYSGS